MNTTQCPSCGSNELTHKKHNIKCENCGYAWTAIPTIKRHIDEVYDELQYEPKFRAMFKKNMIECFARAEKDLRDELIKQRGDALTKSEIRRVGDIASEYFINSFYSLGNEQ